MTRMTGPDCAVMCNLINTHTHTRNTRTSGGGKYIGLGLKVETGAERTTIIVDNVSSST